MSTLRVLLVVATFVALGVRLSAAGTVQVSVSNGLVSIVAKDATLAEILAAWTDSGRTVFINADRLPTDRVTLALLDLPEKDALDVLLRRASGYVAIAREASDAARSRFERILILPTSAPGREAPPVRAAIPPRIVAPSVALAPGVERLLDANGQPVPDDQEDAPPPGIAAAPRGFSFGDEPPTAPVPAASPSSGAAFSPGAPVPGMVVPAPQPPPTTTAPQR